MPKVLLLFGFLSIILVSCKDDCLTCSGTTYAREICESDYLEKSDFQAEISAYEATGGTCE
ncbi:MAG: hypothetical protein H6603_05280 [Flavobacteriales bacterium]|nr:hypothetical protein [Flavobacteriales bacterium]MCB9204372.1 hypothetical protein [Flavobacteriales bacterium]